MKKLLEIVDDLLIEAIQLSSFLAKEARRSPQTNCGSLLRQAANVEPACVLPASYEKNDRDLEGTAENSVRRRHVPLS
jgi:hypothetical protein